MINHLVNQRYEVLEKSGESPLFTVYKARDQQMSRIVALKVVRPPYASDAGFLSALRTGLEAASLLNSPNITRCYEIGEANDVFFAAFEFVRGINLKERIRRIAPFTLSVAMDFAYAVSEALHHAHSMGQVHGDLRPQNIIISPEGVTKVTDFGVQAAIASSTQAQFEILSRSGPYHAPEVSMRNAGTPAGDIYALGAILYEMLTGSPLYAGATSEAVADQHAFAAIPLPRTLNPGIPRSVEGIILKCLQKRPADRYASVSELMNDLKAVRDALRFGKPLSWSPVDIEKLAAAPPRPAAQAEVAAASAVSAQNRPDITPLQAAQAAGLVAASGGRPVASAPPARTNRLEPVAEVAASSQAISMPANNRLRARDERVSGWIKLAIGTVTVMIFCALVWGLGIYSSLLIAPKPISVPQLVGQNIDYVREMAADKKIHLIEHAEYLERPRDIVYRTDATSGEQIRPNRILNVWYSRGPAYVNVPNLVGLQREDAEQKLKDTGLSLGKEITEFHPTAPLNTIIRQDVSSKKRVLHDTPVDLVISDGPKPDYATDDGDAGDAAGGDSGQSAVPAPSPDSAVPSPPEDEVTHDFDRSISIPKDGRGTRKVRIEYTDDKSMGSPVMVVEEDRNEGDKIPVQFPYSGKYITLTIYYNDQKVWEKRFDPQATRNTRVQ